MKRVKSLLSLALLLCCVLALAVPAAASEAAADSIQIYDPTGSVVVHTASGQFPVTITVTETGLTFFWYDDTYTYYQFSGTVSFTGVSAVLGETDPTYPINYTFTMADPGSLYIYIEIAATEPTEPDPTRNPLDEEKDYAENEGKDQAGEIIDVIPDESANVIEALKQLIAVLNYEGTEAKITMPAITVPAVSDLFPDMPLLESQEVDLEYYFTLIPGKIMILIEALFDAAIVAYCLKEFHDLIGSFANGFSNLRKDMDD